MGLMNLDTMDKYELYENACKQTKAALEADARLRHRRDSWRGDMELYHDDIVRIEGAAKALEAVFGVYDFYIVQKLGISEVREKFWKACDRRIDAAS